MSGFTRRRRWKLAALAGAVTLTVSLAACGDSDSGPAGSSSGAATSSGAAAGGGDPQFAWELKFTRCLRGQGIQVDDPDPVEGAPAVVHDDAYLAASRACEAKIGDPPSASGGGDTEAIFERALEEVRCLRDGGADMPDPERDQALQIPEGLSADLVDRCLAAPAHK